MLRSELFQVSVFTFLGYKQGDIFNHNLDFFGYSKAAPKDMSTGTKSIKSGTSTHSKTSRQVKTGAASETEKK